MTLSELLNKKEELSSELRAYIVNDPRLGPMLKHPLVFQVPYSEQLNALSNEQLKHKQEAIDRALKDKNWSQYIFLHERPYRWNALDDIRYDMTKIELGKEFVSVWSDSENIWQHRETIDSLIDDLPARSHLIDADDKKAFNKLPAEIEVFRGCLDRNKTGLSWTLDKERAEWFARRLSMPADRRILLSGKVAKRDVIFYTDARGEKEIVTRKVFSKKVKIL